MKTLKTLAALREGDWVPELITLADFIVTTIKSVFHSQCSRYISGDLSEVTDELLEASKGSPPHNVHSERALGMLNALWDRSKEASTSFLEPKVTFTLNKTMDWLKEKSEEEQRKVIEFSIKMGAVLRKGDIQWRKGLKEHAGQRLLATAQKRDMESRREMEKRIVGVLKARSVEVMSEDDKGMFELLDEEAKKRVQDFVSQNDVKGLLFHHDWDENDGRKETYCGRVVSSIKRTGAFSLLLSYKVKYWLVGLQEPSSKDTTTLKSENLICDLLLGDLRFGVEG